MKKLLFSVLTICSVSAFCCEPFIISGKVDSASKVSFIAQNHLDMPAQVSSAKITLQDGKVCYTEKLNTTIELNQSKTIFTLEKLALKKCLVNISNTNLKAISYAKDVPLTSDQATTNPKYMQAVFSLKYTSGANQFIRNEFLYFVAK